MMKKRAVLTIKKLAAACLLFMFSACANNLASYDLYMDGQLDMNTVSLTGKRVLVYTKKGSDGLVLEFEIAEKLKKALVNNGYIATKNLSNSDYVILFDYGIDTGEEISSTETGYELNPITKRLESSRSTSTETLYTKHLTLKLFSSKRLSNTSAPVWTGKARNLSSDSNLRRSMDYLIAAAFEHFGKDTAGEVFLSINSEDERILNLNGSLP